MALLVGSRTARILLGLMLAAGTLGCRPMPGASVEVRLDGRPLQVLVARRDGMRGRDFGDADAMLFAWRTEQDPSLVGFVMDGVAMPLDIAYFDGMGRWLATTRMEPCEAEPCPRYAAPAPFRWALEAPVGTVLSGLGQGSRLEVAGG